MRPPWWAATAWTVLAAIMAANAVAGHTTWATAAIGFGYTFIAGAVVGLAVAR